MNTVKIDTTNRTNYCVNIGNNWFVIRKNSKGLWCSESYRENLLGTNNSIQKIEDNFVTKKECLESLIKKLKTVPNGFYHTKK